MASTWARTRASVGGAGGGGGGTWTEEAGAALAEASLAGVGSALGGPGSEQAASQANRDAGKNWLCVAPCPYWNHVRNIPLSMSIHPTRWPSGLHPVRGFMSVPELLVDEQGAVLIDTGFPGDLGRIRKAMTRAGVGPHVGK